MTLALTVSLCGCLQTASVGAKTHLTTPSPSILVLANDSGNDFQIESVSTGKVIKDLGAVQGYTNNGLALSPNGRDLYATVNRSQTLMVERIDLANGGESFVADGAEPSISQNGRLLAYATGPPGSQELVVRDLDSGMIRSINLQKLLGRYGDLLSASIAWLGSQIVVRPGGVLDDLMGGAKPPPLKGSCSAVPLSASCLIVVNVRAGLSLTAERVILDRGRLGDAVIGASGSSNLVMAVFDNHHTDVYRANLGEGARTVTHLFSLPSALPQAFSSNGTELFYLHIGQGPIALWAGQVSAHQLKNTKMLNASVAPAGLVS